MATRTNLLNELAGSDSIVRYCKPRECDENGKPGPGAFLLRTMADGTLESYLSCNWLEYLFPVCQNCQVRKSLQVLNAKINVARSAKLAVLNIEEIIRRCAEADNGTLVEIKRADEDQDDRSHAGIYGYTHANADVAAVLANEVSYWLYSTH